MEKRFYVIHNDDTNCEIVVKLTKNEANAIENFIDWADLDTYVICSVDEWDADDWGVICPADEWDADDYWGSIT